MARFQGVPVAVHGSGMSVPDRIVTNEDISKMVETNDEWIRERTGIERRRIAEKGELTSLFAERAGRAALENAGVAPSDVDMIIVATNSPDTLFPGVAPKVQGMLRAEKAGAFDVQSGCTSGVYALVLAVNGIASGIWNNVLVIGAEVLSPLVDWSDRNTCVLFGDGAGAVLLAPSRGKERFLSASLRSDGTKHEQISLPGGLVEHPASPESLERKMHFVSMNGNDVFRFVNRLIPPFLKTLCEESDLSPDDIDWWFFHQANKRIIDRAAERLGISSERVFVNLEEYGNTSAASIFIALSEFMKQGKLLSGQKIVFTAFGAGMTYGGVIYES